MIKLALCPFLADAVLIDAVRGVLTGTDAKAPMQELEFDALVNRLREWSNQ